MGCRELPIWVEQVGACSSEDAAPEQSRALCGIAGATWRRMRFCARRPVFKGLGLFLCNSKHIIIHIYMVITSLQSRSPADWLALLADDLPMIAGAAQ
jgi:hypothetical protein